jgi:site-specific DNA-methyltransferase (adenine-specific)
MRELVVDYTQPGEMVCDPFMGSGTTGVACVQTGRAFCGIEQDEKWFDLSRRRISEALKQTDLFVPKPAPAKQEALDL